MMKPAHGIILTLAVLSVVFISSTRAQSPAAQDSSAAAPAEPAPAASPESLSPAPPPPVSAADAFTTRPLRIAFVDVDRVTADSPTINKLMDAVQIEVTREQGKFETKKLAYDQLRREIQQKESILSADALAEKRAELEKIRREIEDMQFEVEKLMQQSQRRVVEPAMELISEAIRKVGKDFEYDLILRGEVVLHGSRRVDITKLVVWQIEELAKAKKMKAE